MAIIDGVSVSGTVYGLRDNDTNGGIAPTFSTSTAYTAGQYVWYDSGSGAKLYRFTADHAAGAWTGTDAAEVKLGNDVSALKSSIDGITTNGVKGNTSASDWTKGTISASNGASNNSSTRIRTKFLSNDFLACEANDGYKFAVYVYKSDETYVGIFTGTGYVKTAAWNTGFLNLTYIPKTYKIRFLVATTDDSTSIAASDYVNFYAYYPTDKSLTQEYKGADAKAVGEKIADILETINGEMIIYKGTISSSTDFNDVTDIGTYSFASAVSNTQHRPFLQEGSMIVIPASDSVRIAQIAVGSNDAVMYVRTRKSGTWNDWNKLADSNDMLNVMQYRSAYNTAVDFDTLTTIGTYQMASMISDAAPYHRPTRNNLVLIVTATDATRMAQLCVDVDRNELYIRSRLSGVWTEWETTKVSDSSFHDIPESIGIYNIIRRAYQLTTITYTPVATLPNMTADMVAGTEYTGIPYSSVRVEQNFVANAVSLETFMTAMQNANSYLYTKTSTAKNSKAYYGAVCSSFVGFCYGIDNVIPTTISFDSYPGFNRLGANAQNPQGLKLGDMLNESGVHIVIVTDILRDDRGTVQEIQIAEAYTPRCRTRRYTPEYMQTHYFDAGYVAYRYEYADDVPFTDSQWVHVLSDESVTPTWNEVIMPRRGEYANWRYGEDIEFDIDNTDNYTQYIVTNRDTETVVYSGAVSSVITLTSVPAGRYTIHLTDGTNDSENAYFTVQNPTMTYTADGNGNVVVSWDDYSFGTASSILWVNNSPSSLDYQATRAFHILTNEEKTARTATVTPPNMEASEAPGGVWGIRMMYQTEYGIYASDIYQIHVT